MAEGDSIRFEATFNNLDEAVRLFTEELSQQLAKAEAMGEEAIASTIRSQIERVGGPAPGEGVAKATGQLERLNALRLRGVQIDVEMLDVINQQTAAMGRQAALLQSLQDIGAAGWRGARPMQPGVAGAVGQQQAVAERELAETQAYMNEMVGAEAAGRQHVLAIQQEQAATAAKQAAEQARVAELQASPGHGMAATTSALNAYEAGQAAAARGRVVPETQRQALIAGAGARGEDLTAAERGLNRYNIALGEYERFGSQAGLTTQALSANLTRLGVAENEASNSMRRHGALTTEYLQALARGETTVSEFGYQIGATVAKFAGWTIAAGATFAALGAVTEFGKGAIDAANGVQTLTRTIDGLNRTQASTSLQNLSAGVNVPIKEASDAVFQYSRTFHDLPSAVAGARQALMALKLDNVEISDSVKTATALWQQWGTSVQGQAAVWDMLSAGQREYNARISQLIPLLGKASGAVANASAGNANALNQLVQLGVYAQRVLPTVGGTNIGTMFYRSAATFLNPSTKQGAADREQLKALGINPNQSWTQVFVDALQKSLTLSPADRQKVATAMFGPRFGGQLISLFNPQSVPTFTQIAQRVTPGATAGGFQQEFEKQLHTTGQEFHSFTIGLQNLGAALAQTGALSAATGALHGIVGTMNAIRGVIDAFDALPPAMKSVIVGAEALTAVWLAMARTRFGSSVADLTRLSNIPGIGASEATRARFTLRVGTRAAQETVAADLASQSARLANIAADEATINERRLAIEREVAASGRATVTQVEQSARYAAEIAALQNEQTALEADQAASYALSERLAQQQVGLRKRRGPKALSDEQVMGLSSATRAGTNAAEADAAGQAKLALAKGEQAAATEADRLATQEFVAMAKANVAAADAAAVATEGAAVETKVMSGALAGFATRMEGLAAAFDPLLLAMLLVPEAMGEIEKVIQQSDAAAKQARDALSGPLASATDLHRSAQQAQAASKSQATPHISSGPLAILQNSVRGWGALIGQVPGLGRVGGGIQDWVTGRDVAGAERNDRTASALQGLSQLYTAAGQQFQKDGAALAGTKPGRDQLGRDATEMKQRMMRALLSSGLGPAQIDKIYQGYAQSVNEWYQQSIDAATAKGAAGGDPSSMMEQYKTALQAQPATVVTELQSFDDYQKIFGANRQALNAALARYSALVTQAAKPANITNQALLQQVTSGESNITSSVQSTIESAMRAAALATTNRGQLNALTGAVNSIQGAEAAVKSWAAKMKSNPKLVQALNELMGLIAQSVQSSIQSVLQQLQSQSSAAVSGIQGISPEADLARAQAAISGPGGLRAQLTYAKAHHAGAQTINTLTAQLNDAQTQLTKQQVSNAQSIAQANEQLTVSQITGITPADDLRRAQVTVENARQQLQFARTHGQGAAAVATAQANLDSAVYSLNQQLVSNAQATAQDAASLIQAQGQLQQAETLDPIQQAREQLATDIKVLATIRPSQFKNYREYQAAYTAAQAKIAQDERGVTSQILSTRMSTLQYEFDTQQISSQQYINGLQSLLKLHKLTRQQVQQIKQTIFDTAHGTAVNLNTGSIKLPTTYEVRRAIAGAMRAGAASAGGVGRAGQSAVTQNNHLENHVQITVNVARQADIKGVSDAIDKGLNSNLTSAAQAAGLLGS